MKLARLGDLGAEIPVLVVGKTYYDLRSVVADLDGVVLADGALERIAEARAAGTLAELEGAASMRIGAPIARPSAILCIGMNYAAHAKESGSAPPERPILFLKTPNTVGGPDDAVDIPRASLKTDWEVELGVIIGERALYLDSPAQAGKHIAGYVAANDLSERTFQFELSGGQWSKGKSSPGFTPLGPWFVTADEIDPCDLRLRSWVNGEPRQDSSTADLIFPVDYIVWHLSQFLALEPGDVILTGTPEGVALSGRFPYLTAGDVVEIEIEGLGRQRQVFERA
jgi:2-keto-4-pentenoate hydratase/2-oxohepta-3-ene-1,7-dioic acid hydratase in catechol pathway